MRPRSFYLLGLLLTLAGFIAMSIGIGIEVQIYACTTVPATCTLTASDLGALTITAAILLFFAFSLIIVGAIWTASGHITEHIAYTPATRPAYPGQYAAPAAPGTAQAKVCTRCGSIVGPNAKFCSNCGTPWLAPVNPP